jgi:hypothetical protein
MKYNQVVWCGIEGMFGSWAIPLQRLTKQGSLFGTERETHFAWQPHPAGQGNPARAEEPNPLSCTSKVVPRIICSLAAVELSLSLKYRNNKIELLHKKKQKVMPCGQD